ncbi:TRAP transporter large permease [uncultured Oscillibacter sp.]|uniref:TRAP transporter large permease n=1 Tax=uncultured Oscillibacter sp. TaxID=876091 RepID=UPI0025FDABAE|nr:TRAP transporter large permease [uncultured Oscillibacter sp.]
MSTGLLALVFFLAFFAMLFLGTPITYALGGAGALAMLASGLKMSLVIKSVLSGFGSFTLLAIFLFTLMGVIYQKTGLASLLVDALKPSIGKRKGGLALIAVYASAIFGALTGSANATCATFSKMLGPEMIDNGYPADWTAATIAACAPLGQLIPPSVTCIVLGVATGLSIGSLFIVDLSIGLLTVVFLTLTIIYLSRKHGFGGSDRVYTAKEKRDAFLRFLPLVSVPVVVIGGMYGGVFTATEAGAIGSAFSFLLALVYGRLNLRLVRDIFADAGKTAATVLLLCASSYVISYVMSMSGMTKFFVELMTGICNVSPILGMLFLLAVLLVMGCFIDLIVLCIILAPTAVAALAPFGINAYAICAVFLIGNLIGIITPPVGVALFISSSSLKVKMEDISKRVVPYILVYVVLTVLLIVFPDLSLLLPRLLGMDV